MTSINFNKCILKWVEVNKHDIERMNDPYLDKAGIDVFVFASSWESNPIIVICEYMHKTINALRKIWKLHKELFKLISSCKLEWYLQGRMST